MSNQHAKARWLWLWPSVKTAEDAKGAIMFALASAILCSATTIGFVGMSLLGVGFAKDLNVGADALVDASLFLLIAWGLWKHSRLAAWSGLVLYLFERAFMWSTIGMRNPVIALVLTLGFISGVRGASALHRMRASSKVDATSSQREEEVGRAEVSR